MSEWQPIETAPYDEPFLGVRVEEGNEPTYWLISGLQMRYAGEEERPGKGYRWNALTGGMYNIKLTHWMPLPPPPHNPESERAE